MEEEINLLRATMSFEEEKFKYQDQRRLSELEHHTQVIAGPLNLSRVSFNCLQKVTVESLNFNLYNC